jgi:hypothetical protein
MNNSKNILFYFIVFVVPFSALGQGIIEFNEYNILYRDYENHLQIGSLNGDSNLLLKSNDCEIRKSSVDWIVKPTSTSKTVILFVLNSDDDTLSIESFRVNNLPTPEVCLGRYKNGDKLFSRETRKLYVKFPQGCQISKDFQIQKWAMRIEGYSKEITGTGDLLSSEAMKIIALAPEFSKMTFTVWYNSYFGLFRFSSSSFSL